MARLNGKVAVVTGASGGIGAGIALALAREGAKVCISGRRMHALEEVKHEILQSAGNSVDILVVEVDVTLRDKMKHLVQEVEEKLGPIDIFVNNAGVMHFQLLKNINEDSWDKMVDINCKGVLHGIAAVLPGMLSRKKGHIVNISSDAGKKVFPGLGVYSATKMFVEGISQALRLETVGTGIRVTSIQPGNVATKLVANANQACGTDEEAMKLYCQPSDCDVLSPSDIGNAVVYAVSQPPHVAVNEVLIEPRDEPI